MSHAQWSKQCDEHASNTVEQSPRVDSPKLKMFQTRNGDWREGSGPKANASKRLLIG